jgi:O-antigen/teichoic acid export membrane protein
MISYLKNKVGNFWNAGHERTLKIKRNIIYSFLIKGASVVLGFVLIPITIHYVNQGQYGVWLIIASLVSWINTFDIGLSNGLRNKMAHSLALDENEDIVKYISTTYAILCIISAAAFIIFYIAGSFFDWNRLLNINSAVHFNIWPIIIITLASFCIQFILQPIKSILTAMQQPFMSSLILLLIQFLTFVFTWLLTIFTKSSLFNLVIVVTVAPVLVFIITSIYLFNTNLKTYKPRFSAIDMGSAKSLLNLGGVFFFIQIGALILFETDNIIITRTLGPGEVTTFNIAYKYFSVAAVIFVIMLTPYWSAFTDAYAKKDMEWIKHSINKMRQIWLYISIGTVLLYLFSGLFYKVWIGSSLAIPNLLSLAMAIYMILSNWQGIYAFALNGIGKLRLQLIFVVAAGIINVPLSIILIKWMGVAGTVFSNIILAIVMNIAYTYQTKLIVAQKATGIWNK